MRERVGDQRLPVCGGFRLTGRQVLFQVLAEFAVYLVCCYRQRGTRMGVLLPTLAEGGGESPKSGTGIKKANARIWPKGEQRGHVAGYRGWRHKLPERTDSMRWVIVSVRTIVATMSFTLSPHQV